MYSYANVNFHGSDLVAVSRNSDIFVSIPSICLALGIDDRRPRKKLQDNPVYRVELLPITANDHKCRETLCIPLRTLDLWLGSLQPARIEDPRQRERILRFQAECAEVLYAHFRQRPDSIVGAISEQLNVLTSMHSENAAKQQERDAQTELLVTKIFELDAKIDSLTSMSEMVFGESRADIQKLVDQVCRAYDIDGRTLWGHIRVSCNVSHYKRQSRIIIEFLNGMLAEKLKSPDSYIVPSHLCLHAPV